MRGWPRRRWVSVDDGFVGVNGVRGEIVPFPGRPRPRFISPGEVELDEEWGEEVSSFRGRPRFLLTSPEDGVDRVSGKAGDLKGLS